MIRPSLQTLEDSKLPKILGPCDCPENMMIRNHKQYEMYLKPQFRSPQPRDLSPQHHQRSERSIRSSQKALKPLIKGRQWIPGGHPNSLGRNKLSSFTQSTLYY